MCVRACACVEERACAVRLPVSSEPESPPVVRAAAFVFVCARARAQGPLLGRCPLGSAPLHIYFLLGMSKYIAEEEVPCARACVRAYMHVCARELWVWVG